MKQSHFIGLDAHCQFTEMAVVNSRGEVVRRQRCPTTIPALAELLGAVPRPCAVALEEGPLADWLWRNLAPRVEQFTVCDPRRNGLIAKDSDKDDPIDAAKLAQLLRGGYLRAVHHPEALGRAVFKQWVLLYHDRVRQRVQEANRVMAYLRRYGIFVRERAFRDPGDRPGLAGRLPPEPLAAAHLQVLWQSYDLAAAQVRQLRQRLTRQAAQEDVIRRWQELPGIGWVRAASLFVFLDTPWRFPSKAALWKYLGVGLERRHSGPGPARVRVVRRSNRVLKGVIVGAAQRAIGQGANPFAEQYRRWLKAGVPPGPARRNVARALAAAVWGMWKSGSAYHPEWVGAVAAAAAARGEPPWAGPGA
jgi:transposase